MKYRLMKLVDDEWYEWGTYKNVEQVAMTAFFLGQTGGIESIKVEEVE